MAYLDSLTLLTLRAVIRPDAKTSYAEWQALFNEKILSAPGFVSLEFLAERHVWVIVQRFYSQEEASLWRSSATYEQLKRELSLLTFSGNLEEKRENEERLTHGVTSVIITQVKPNQEEAYRKWSAKIHQMEAKFEGFRGFYMQSPRGGGGDHWVTLLQFDTPTNLDKWFASAERLEVLKESISMVSSCETHRITSPYAGWFSSLTPHEEAPSIWQQTMMVLLVLFPIVMLESKYLTRVTEGLNPALSTFISNTLSVTLLSFPFMPLAIKALKWWLFPGEVRRLQKIAAGTLLVCLLYFLEVLFFWNFY